MYTVDRSGFAKFLISHYTLNQTHNQNNPFTQSFYTNIRIQTH